eukprot:CAMPEP_0178915954 /NCGR_PEP_ID=MMETSP0786-20121207/12340_1 /TAXON_ID=186022 /ORGANISM="Thalassionema frauenfeldii, Strain CCMP 1798" /LENGTH=79 /DNA_ID=CAMNT_0020589175 /DNA_START=82 /DNA_END=318 /DNA_ORIENTATION=-
MGNDLSSQASMLAAKSKMSNALSSVEGELSGEKKEGESSKTGDKKYDKMRQETDEVYKTKQIKQKERVITAKARWEAAR